MAVPPPPLSPSPPIFFLEVSPARERDRLQNIIGRTLLFPPPTDRPSLPRYFSLFPFPPDPHIQSEKGIFTAYVKTAPVFFLFFWAKLALRCEVGGREQKRETKRSQFRSFPPPLF